MNPTLLSTFPLAEKHKDKRSEIFIFAYCVALSVKAAHKQILVSMAFLN